MAAPRKLRLPPGFYHNGTEYMAAGRYVGGDLVRWHGDAIEPIQGWQRRYDAVNDIYLAPLWVDPDQHARSMCAIGDQTLGVTLWVGTNKNIYQVSNSNVVTVVTPAGFVDQGDDVAYNVGYGIYRYGFGQYGTQRPRSQSRAPNAFSWGFAEWGFWPVACARGVGGVPLYIKDDDDPIFRAIANSPLGAFDCVVTDERILMAIGLTTDFRMVQWSDQENFEVWTPSSQNQAGDLRLAGNGRLLRAVKVLNHVLILGENDAFTAQYVGPPYIYGFQRAGDACGIIGAEAVGVTDSFAVWIGAYNFWIFDGTIRKLECEVLDYFLRDINEQQRSKTQAFTVADFTEIWWLYQSKNSLTGEPDKYIVFNYGKNIWYFGSMDRTAGIGSDPLNYVAMVASNGVLYDHEVRSAGKEGRIPFIETGPLEWSDGERLVALSHVYPDVEVEGSVNMRLDVRDMPQLPVRYYRDFTLRNPTSTTGIMGRDIRMTLTSAEINQTWKIGDFRAVPVNVGPMR